MTVATFTPATDLVRFAEEASQVHNIAKALATTNFVPAAMQGRPDEITAAILFGRELNLDPMTALQTVHVIERRPTLSANAMRGLATAAGVKFRVDEINDTRVVMSAMAPGDNQWTTVTWTMDRAKRMGLDTKSNWKKMPQDMMVARCTSQLCRLVASNVLIGLPYSTEEMQDGVAEESAPPKLKLRKSVPPPAAPQQGEDPWEQPWQEPKVSRREDWDTKVIEPPAALPAAEQDAPQEQKAYPEPMTEESSTVTGLPVRVRTNIMAAFNSLGIRAREDRLRRVVEIVNREVHSVNQLTAAEGSQVLDVLQGEVNK